MRSGCRLLVVGIIIYSFYDAGHILARRKIGTLGSRVRHTYVTKETACPRKSEMKFAIMIPTHNRREYVKLMADSLRSSVGIRRVEIWVYDDASTDFGEEELRKWFTYAQKGIRNTHLLMLKKRVGAHRNSRRILEETLKRSDANVLIHLDSDMVLCSTWIMKLKGWLASSDGIISLFRSGSKDHREMSCDRKMCIKDTIGSAGTVWCRDLLIPVLEHLPSEPTAFDYQYSTFLTENTFRLLVPKESAALHFGLYSSRSKRQLTKTDDIGGVEFKWSSLDKKIAERAQAFLDGASPDDPPIDKKLLKKKKKYKRSHKLA